MNELDEFETRLRETLEAKAKPVRGAARVFDPTRRTRFSAEPLHVGPSSARRNAARILTIAAAILILTVGTFMLVRRGSQGDRGDGSLGVAGVPSTTARNGKVPLDSLDSIFPATRAEYLSGIESDGYLGFINSVSNAAQRQCLASAGQSEDTGGGAMFMPLVKVLAPDNGVYISDFADIARFKAGNVPWANSVTDSLQVEMSPPRRGTAQPNDGSPTATSQADADARLHCEVTSEQRSRDLSQDAVYSQVDNLTKDWLFDTDMANMNADPKVARANTAYIACMASRGYTVGVNPSTGSATDLITAALKVSNDKRRLKALEQAYGNCYEPVADALDDFRLAKRNAKYRSDDGSLQKLADAIVRSEQQLSKEYGVPLPQN